MKKLHYPSMIKNLHSNCEMNTGHINTLKHPPESCNLDLSNAPKNTKNGPVWVKKLNHQNSLRNHL